MNVQLLIDAVVRQTTVLIAQLATAGGVRAPLAHIANQVFSDLTAELEAQGVSRKVSADMFGMALRAYRRKVHRLRESSTEQGQSLWNAVLGFIESGQVLTRTEILRRFRNDDATSVRGVLQDLVESGLIAVSGAGSDAVYRKATEEERSVLTRNGAGLDEFVWVLVYREGPLSIEALSKLSNASHAELTNTLDRLLQEGRVEQTGSLWSASTFSVPLGSEAGWEAALFDHYHAMVKTLCARLGRPKEPSRLEATTGGSTYTLDVWTGHPLEQEVLGVLKNVREQVGDLRARVVHHNTQHPAPERYRSVVFYAGQCTTDEGRLENEA